MLVENHKCRCATFASGSTNDLTAPIGELFGALERSNCPINPNPLSLALECLIVLDQGVRLYIQPYIAPYRGRLVYIQMGIYTQNWKFSKFCDYDQYIYTRKLCFLCSNSCQSIVFLSSFRFPYTFSSLQSEKSIKNRTFNA